MLVYVNVVVRGEPSSGACPIPVSELSGQSTILDVKHKIAYKIKGKRKC